MKTFVILAIYVWPASLVIVYQIAYILGYKKAYKESSEKLDALAKDMLKAQKDAIKNPNPYRL